MDDFVRDMHTSSGLLDEIRASELTLAEAGRITLEFIRAHVPKPRTVPLAGNSIGTDRRFLAAYLPDIEEYLHYRSVDVSTVKELAARWYPEAMAAAPTKAGGHRAMDDIQESVAELAYYRATVFRDTDPLTAPSAGMTRRGARDARGAAMADDDRARRPSGAQRRRGVPTRAEVVATLTAPGGPSTWRTSWSEGSRPGPGRRRRPACGPCSSCPCSTATRTSSSTRTSG